MNSTSYEEPHKSRSQSVTARVPPHNLDAEASVLGAMLLSRDAIGPAVEILSGCLLYTSDAADE